MNQRQYRREWIRNHAVWERRAINIVQTSMNKIYRSIPVSKINRQNWQAVIALNIQKEPIREMVMDIWRFAGLLSGRWALDMLEAEIAKGGHPPGLEVKNKPLFDARFNQLLARYFLDENKGGKHIQTIQQTAINTIRVDIAVWLAANGGTPYTLEQIRDKIAEIAGEGYPRWMALRIARTEVTAAANWAALEGAKQGKYKVAKEWIAIKDDRTRTFDRGDKFDHMEMDGVRVGLDDFFEQRGVQLLFPGDPNARPDAKTTAAMNINCRCTIAIVPVRDANGRLILRNPMDGADKNP